MHSGKSDRAADSGAVIVLGVFRLCLSGGCAVLVGIEYPVTDVVVARSVEFAAARPRLDNELSGGAVAVLGRVVSSENRHLAGDVRRHAKVSLKTHHAALVHETFQRGGAIHQSFVTAYLAPVDLGVVSIASAAGADTGKHQSHSH